MTSGLSFGSNPGMTFGSGAQTTQAGFSFGTSTPTTSGFSFGSSAATTTANQPVGGLSFGQSGGFNVAGTTPATTSQSLFGQSPGFSFGSTVTTASQPTLNFGTSATTTAPAFGATATTATPTFGATATTTQSGFSFGTSTTAPATTQSGLSFGATSTGLNFNGPVTQQTPGFFAPATTSASSLFSTTKPSFGLPTTSSSLFGPKPATAAPSLGGNLGGEVTPPSLIKAVKDNAIPPEMLQLVEIFKTTVKQQKNDSSEVTRSSFKPIQKTTDDIESIKHLLIKLERSAYINKCMITKLKADTIRCTTDCEMAQRTLELSSGFQPDNVAPLDYFAKLADRFQEQVVHLRVEIENTEKHIQSALNPAALSPQELNASMKRLHECFVALAGRMQLVHSSMSSVKQNHLEMRRKKTSDFSDIFDRKQAALKEKTDLVTSTAPLTANSLYSSVAALVQSKVPEQPQQQGFNQSSPALGGFSFQQPIQPTTVNQNVQLKSPPGSKRGKR